MDFIFGERPTVATIMRIEAALARAQAQLGIIPVQAAQEITQKAQESYAPYERIEVYRDQVGHPLVATLKAWSEQLSEDSAAFLHFGATTPDIRLTTQILQMRAATQYILRSARVLEEHMLRLASEYQSTPMMGRTVGRHALPISFGLKVSTWMLENRRNMARLSAWLERTNSGVLAGAVGTYAALGELGFEVEALTMQELGLGPAEAADWKGTRDKHAEWGAVLAIMSKSLARMAQDIFLLQGDDFAELDEANQEVGSSTMPHKSNPRKATAIIGLSRQIAHESAVLLDWMVSIYERDQISNDSSLASLASNMEKLLRAAEGLLADLKVYPQNMERNLQRTGGLIMAERVMFALGPYVGKHKAHGLVHGAAKKVLRQEMDFRSALLAQTEIATHLGSQRIDALLDHKTYLGLAPQAVQRAVEHVQACRALEASLEKELL